jgi:hypothetical protein
LPELHPVRLAATAGVLPADVARRLLEQVARLATGKHETSVRVGAALTGIDPPVLGRGLRGDPGPGDRHDNAATVLGRYGEDGAKRLRGELGPYYHAFAEAVVVYVRGLRHSPENLEPFLAACQLRPDQVEELLGLEFPTPNGSAASQQAASRGTAAMDRSRRVHDRSVPMAGALRSVLDVARDSCASKGRAFYTPDLMLALIDLPGGRTVVCLEVARPGASKEVRAWLYETIAALSDGADPFRPFEWIERPEVRRAQELASADGTGIVTDLHLLLAVLEGESSTSRGLAQVLGAHYDRLRSKTDQARRQLPEVLPTPGPRGRTPDGRNLG